MPIVRKRRRTTRRSRFPRQAAWLATALTALLACLGLACLNLTDHQNPRAQSARERAYHIARLSSRAARLIYPYSIIRGGAFSKEEAFEAMRSDHVVARHYQAFQGSRLHTVTSPFEKPVYVSYRMNDAVYWTRRPVKLAANETLLTDGTEYARARCGNRISALPMTPVADLEPPPQALDEPEVIPKMGFLNNVDIPYPATTDEAPGPEDYSVVPASSSPVKTASVPEKTMFGAFTGNTFLFPSPGPLPARGGTISLPTGLGDGSDALTLPPIAAVTLTPGYGTNVLTVPTVSLPAFTAPADYSFQIPNPPVERVTATFLTPPSILGPSAPYSGELVFHGPIAPVTPQSPTGPPVPEPSPVLTLSLGLGALLLWGIRRN